MEKVEDKIATGRWGCSVTDCWLDGYSDPSSARQTPDHTSIIMAYRPRDNIDKAGASTFHHFENCRDKIGLRLIS